MPAKLFYLSSLQILPSKSGFVYKFAKVYELLPSEGLELNYDAFNSKALYLF